MIPLLRNCKSKERSGCYFFYCPNGKCDCGYTVIVSLGQCQIEVEDVPVIDCKESVVVQC
jgi:hypothetical protein